MIRTRSGPKIPVEFFDNFILWSDEDTTIWLQCKNCPENVYSDRQSGTLSDFMMAAGEHKCPASPAEDSSTMNAETPVLQDAVAKAMEKHLPETPSQSKGNPYAKAEGNEGPPITTVIPKKNVL